MGNTNHPAPVPQHCTPTYWNPTSASVRKYCHSLRLMTLTTCFLLDFHNCSPWPIWSSQDAALHQPESQLLSRRMPSLNIGRLPPAAYGPPCLLKYVQDLWYLFISWLQSSVRSAWHLPYTEWTSMWQGCGWKRCDLRGAGQNRCEYSIQLCRGMSHK